jgi:hypothetical protein
MKIQEKLFNIDDMRDEKIRIDRYIFNFLVLKYTGLITIPIGMIIVILKSQFLGGFSVVVIGLAEYAFASFKIGFYEKFKADLNLDIKALRKQILSSK